jgi:hypothetical protein
MLNKIPALFVGLAVVILVTSCVGQAHEDAASPTPSPGSSQTPSASASPTASVPVESAPSGQPTAPATGSAPVTGSAPAPVPAEPVECDGNDLSISIESQPMASGAGSFYSELTFTNNSDATCFMEGPPSIFNLADSATGMVVGMREEDSGLPEVVQLAPGASAYSTIHFANAGAYDCDTAVADVAKVSPPNWDSSQTITLESPITVCTTPATYNVSWVSADTPF